MITTDRKEQFCFWAFMTTVLGTNMVLAPDIWMSWLMLLAGLALMASVRQHLERLLICTLWAGGGGLIVLFSLFIFIGQDSSRFSVLALIVGFVIWNLFLLTEDKIQVRHQLFRILAPFHMGLQAVLISANEAIVLLVFSLLIQLALYLVIAFDGSTREPAGLRQQAFRWIAISVAGSLLVAIPLTMTRHISDMEVSTPSIGALPQTTTSNATVFKATFQGLSPNATHWEHPDIYLIPSSHGQWLTLNTLPEYVSPNINPPIEQAHNLISARVGAGVRTYEHTMTSTWSSWSIKMPGTTTIRAIEEASNARTVSSSRSVWMAYKDVPIKGFTPALDSVYLSIPAGTLDPYSGIDLTGAQQNMPKTWALVQQWKQEGLTDEQFIARTLEYFSQNLAYHFDHQSTDPYRNELDWFLFTERKGVCRHFANAFALMMRMGGIRSRIRGGFYGGEMHEGNGVVEWKIRKREAHAWTEVWKDGQGWVLIDPTHVVPVEKGIPESKWSIAGFLGDGLSDIKWMSSFQTSGTAGGAEEQGIVGQTMERVRQTLLSLDPKTVKLLMLSALTFVLLGISGWMLYKKYQAYMAIPAEDRQWQKLKVMLRTRGVSFEPHHGPRTIGKRSAWLWTGEDQKLWLALVEQYEQWKFGGQVYPDLQVQLRQWRKRIGHEHPRQATIAQDPEE